MCTIDKSKAIRMRRGDKKGVVECFALECAFSSRNEYFFHSGQDFYDILTLKTDHFEHVSCLFQANVFLSYTEMLAQLLWTKKKGERNFFSIQ